MAALMHIIGYMSCCSLSALTSGWDRDSETGKWHPDRAAGGVPKLAIAKLPRAGTDTSVVPSLTRTGEHKNERTNFFV
jgi:hypothetical protein